MNKQQLQANIKAIRSDMEDMQSELDKMESQLQQADQPWKPTKGGDGYWTRDLDHVFKASWDDHEVDHDRWEVGLVYQTKELAQAAHEKQVIQTTIRRRIAELNDGWEPDWSNSSQGKCSIYRAHQDREWQVFNYGVHQHTYNWQYLKTSKLAKQLISEFSSDELKLGLL